MKRLHCQTFVTALRRSFPTTLYESSAFRRGAATNTSNGSSSSPVTPIPPDSTIRNNDATKIANEIPASSPPILPPPIDASQASFGAAASSSLQSASSTPTPSSMLSSFSESTPKDNGQAMPSSLRSQEFQDKNFLEKLQDVWYERSGTSEILHLKESVNEASLEFDQASAKVTFARQHLDGSLRDWERTSGQHLQLLQRRESWTTEDAQTFADLVSREITTRTALEQARQDLAAAEETLSKRQLEYMNRMRRRYHEEQI